MRNLKVATKLILGFSIVAALTAIVGIVGIIGTTPVVDIILIAATCIIAISLGLYIARLIKPLTPIADFMHIAGTTGGLELRPEDVENIKKLSEVKDEIGQLSNAATEFFDHVREISRELHIVSDGDFSTDFPALSAQDELGISLHKMISGLNDMFGEVKMTAGQVSVGARQVSEGAQSLAQASTEQASAIEELSEAITNVSEKTKNNAGLIERAVEAAHNIKNNAQKGNRHMDDLMSAVREITEASHSINQVIKVIDDIAFQTNILALNAAVEAARAGQHGKGFAVVAEEVRNLASKSSEAAKNTGVLIQNSIQKADLGARIAEETAASLMEIVSGIDESDKAVSEIASSSEKQSDDIEKIRIDIDQLTSAVQQNSATAEESAATAEEMDSQAESLTKLMSRFKMKN